MENEKKKILTFIGHYLPGYKSGGPVRTISNMLNVLSEHYDFKIITRDRDQFENKSYDGIKINEWNKAFNSIIYYSNLRNGLKSVINNTEFDTYYLNSLFDFHFSIKVLVLLKLKLIPPKPVLLAPRGELSKGALSLKRIKKRFYLLIAGALKLYKGISWHASSVYEAEEIKREFGENVKINIAMDVPDFNLTKTGRTHKKEKGKLRILFISSITPKKNLHYVIDVLNKVKGDFILDIYGPVKDNRYWKKCLNHINNRIKNRITYKGIVPHNLIHTIYPDYDLFFFPTLGENFGHVIFESLYFGTPVLCSGTTPWDKLDYFNAGWNIDLNRQEQFLSVIEELMLSCNDEYEKYKEGCEKYLSWLRNKNTFAKENINLLD